MFGLALRLDAILNLAYLAFGQANPEIPGILTNAHLFPYLIPRKNYNVMSGEDLEFMSLSLDRRRARYTP
jgi:hypothetical protein